MNIRMPKQLAYVALATATMLVIGACASDGAGEEANTDTVRASSRVEPASPSAPDIGGAPDEQMQAVLDELQRLGPKPLATLGPAEARRQPTPADAVEGVMARQGKSTSPDPSVTSVDRTIPGPGGAIPVRVFTPVRATPALPIVVYYHGGGWVIADKNVYDAGARALSKLANAVVISVDYRRGPEHKFPAAHDDAIVAYAWALKNAASIGGDSMRVALAGESAGGGLAVATAVAAREGGLRMPAAVVSVYPIAGTDTTTPSYVAHAHAKPLNRAMMSWFFDHYLRGGADRSDARVNLLAADLRGLPPTIIVNAQIDPLRSEGERLAERLRAAGVAVHQRTWEGAAHEFFGMAAVVDDAMEAQQWAADALRRAFDSVVSNRSVFPGPAVPRDRQIWQSGLEPCDGTPSASGCNAVRWRFARRGAVMQDVEGPSRYGTQPRTVDPVRRTSQPAAI